MLKRMEAPYWNALNKAKQAKVDQYLPVIQETYPQVVRLWYDPHGNIVEAHDAMGHRLPISTAQLQAAGLKY